MAEESEIEFILYAYTIILHIKINLFRFTAQLKTYARDIKCYPLEYRPYHF